MNWGRIVLAGALAGLVTFFANFLLHGVIMAGEYAKYSVFTKEEANPLWFLLIGICIGIPIAALFAKTRKCWGPGLAGGATFGFFVGLVLFFQPFYNPLVLQGFPYHLGWCMGGIDLIVAVLYGATVGLVYKA